jgi:predicted transcriptional regulator
MTHPELSPAQREVLLAMHGHDSDSRPYVRTLAREADLPVEQVRQIIRTFDSYGWVTHGPVFDSDSGAPMGSTWWLTDKGLAAQREHESAAG